MPRTRRSAGRVIEIAGHEQVIRGRGYVKNPADIGESPIKVVDGTPVRVKDVATVSHRAPTFVVASPS